ncbi:DNA polymerase interacting tetratricopeptide repeat-containing, protein of 47 kDa-like [Uloborus diversus]|uniref:DNA polymerase interacting tetratricopeptide repeat-containing, protein of 47 kDa-like n=1 Tax=Uloborus diversus TaxID=327109 RepID=UPI002409EC4F|nr:DNA polymerase interacting tetratricopeptide repeat-containing, protein of 47 kDa-like [Uloborus diversus]
MSDEEKSKLVQKLNKDVEEFISNLPKKKYEDGWPEDKWEEEMEKHPMFMSKAVKEGQDLPPLVEALQQLKYDPDTNSPEELAKSYKEDGNQNFKRKKYRWAVDAYTKGLEQKSGDNEVNAQLYTNRAAAHYHIGNFKKALKDASEAKSLKPDHVKALQRGALCCYELQEYGDCISWCNEGLKIEENNQSFLELKKKAHEKKTTAERDRRKAAKLELKRKKDAELVKKAIVERKICIAEGYDFDFAHIKSVHPECSSTVHLEDGKLVWPVMLFYPEYNFTEYIENFHEESSLYEEFGEMLKNCGRPDWDKDKKYLPGNLNVYFSHGNDCMVAFDERKPLKSALSHPKFKVHSATPSFFITAANSEFDHVFRNQYNLPNK